MKRIFMAVLLATAMLCIPNVGHAQQYGVTTEADEQNTPSGWAAVRLPQLPTITSANTFNITSYGAETSSTDNTDAIQAACDAVTSDGGVVVIPAGTWLCGKIRLKSKTILHLDAGATLKLLDYTTYQAKYNNDGHNFIENNSGATDIVIEGADSATSVIDGQGVDWWKLRDEGNSAWDNLSRGTLIRFTSGSRFLVKNLKFKDAPGVNVTLGQSGRGSDFTVHDVQILEPASTLEYLPTANQYPSHNTDGISMWAPYINIYNCYISNGDDNVVVDSNGQYVHVWNCTFGTGHGASIGSYTSNVHDVIYEGITFNKTEAGFKIKSSRGRSGSVYNIIFRNSTLNGVLGNNISFDCWYGNSDADRRTTPSTAASADSVSTTPYYHNILVQNITATGTPYNKRTYDYFPIYIFGLPESRISDITFDNVNLSTEKKMFLAYCHGINFVNDCKINGTTLTADNVAANIATEYDATYLVNGPVTDVTPTPDSTRDTTTTTPGIGDEIVTLSSSTCTNENKSDPPYVFSDGYTISNSGGKTYGAGSGTFKDYIKYSRNVQYTINLPAGVHVEGVKISGYSNVDDGTAYVSEVNGKTFEATDYPFVSRTENEAKEYTITLESPVSNTLTFTFGGNQVGAIFTLYAPATGTGISNAVTVDTDNGNGAWYTIDGKRLAGEPTQHGVYIHNGKKQVVK